jgi:hypothetical protein
MLCSLWLIWSNYVTDCLFRNVVHFVFLSIFILYTCVINCVGEYRDLLWFWVAQFWSFRCYCKSTVWIRSPEKQRHQMALFRRFFYRKPPDRLLEISERVYGTFFFLLNFAIECIFKFLLNCLLVLNNSNLMIRFLII